jgi:hypothetical protein
MAFGFCSPAQKIPVRIWGTTQLALLLASFIQLWAALGSFHEMNVTWP